VVLLLRLLTPVIVCVVDRGDENEQREWEGVVKANDSWNSVNDPQITERNCTKFIVVYLLLLLLLLLLCFVCCALMRFEYLLFLDCCLLLIVMMLVLWVMMISGRC